MSGPLLQGVDAFLFDMDGVLVDSNPVHCEAWERFNLRYGLATTPEMHRRMYGKRNDQIVRDFFGEAICEEEVHARGRAKEHLYREMMAGQLENKLVPGVRRFLDLYHHMPMAVASNAEPENVNFLLDGAGLRKYFKAVVDGHQVARPKPHPDVYLLAAQLLGAEPERCVVFEDSHAGAEAGVAAGMKVIGLSTTFVSLPGTCLTVDNFLSGELDSWLDARVWPG